MTRDSQAVAPSEGEIEAWEQEATDSHCSGLQTSGGYRVFQVGYDTISKGLALMRRAAAAQAPAMDLVAHLRRQSEWSARTFGPGDRTLGVVDHIHRELAEVVADRNAGRDTLPEWIDVAILAFDGAWRSGATPEQIAEALAAKQAKNECRSWPDWRTADPDKAIEHDRSNEKPAAPSSGNDKLRRLRETILARRDAIRAERQESWGTARAIHARTWSNGLNEAIQEIDRLLAEPSEPAAADGELLAKAEALVKRLDTVHADPAYMGVWTLYHVHGGRYDGPQYHTEVDALRAAIAKAREAKR